MFRCTEGIERRRAAFAIGGAAAAGAAGLGLALVAPVALTRRRRLRPLPAALAPADEHVRRVATEAGIERPPATRLGSVSQRDAFSYGIPGRYRIALPPALAVRWRTSPLFDAVVRHELAHVRHGDVAWAWLARSIWYALAPLLALPVVYAIVSGDRSLLPGYLWRAAALGAVVQLVAAALLRTREFEADLRAARWTGDDRALAAALEHERAAARRRPRALAKHPAADERLRVLEHPGRLTRAGLIDGLAPAFLAALSLPIMLSALRDLLPGTGGDSAAIALTALIAGGLLAGSTGLAFARAALAGRATGVRPGVGLAALGVGLGLVAGQTISLRNAGADLATALPPAWWLAVTGMVGVGVTVLAAALAELWTDAAPALRRATASWMPLIALQSLLFAIALWFVTEFAVPAEDGWDLLGVGLITRSSTTVLSAAVAVLAAAALGALVAARTGSRTPGWAVERGSGAPWPVPERGGLGDTLASGAAAGLAAAGALLIAGRDSLGSDGLERLTVLMWSVAGAAVAATAALAVLRGRRGLGAALLAAPLAGLIAGAGWLATARAPLTADTIRLALRPLPLGLVAVTLVAPLALRPLVRVRVASWLVSAATAGMAAAAVLVLRQELAPPPLDETLRAGIERSQAERDATFLPGFYVSAFVPGMIRRGEAVDRAAAAAGKDPDMNATRFRARVVAPMRLMLADARANEQIARGSLRTLHASCTRALAAKLAAYEAVASAGDAQEAGDEARSEALVRRAEVRMGEFRRHWRAWLDGVLKLREDVEAGRTG